MVNNSKDIYQYNANLVKTIFKKKKMFHYRQARLPVEEKVKILIKLQKIALTLRPYLGEDDSRMIWSLK